MKAQVNFRASGLTQRQMVGLQTALGMSQTELITVAIDRMYREEIGKMNTSRYDYATTSRSQLAEELLGGAGYNPADFEGQTPTEIAAAVESVYREWAATGESPYPTWTDGDEIDVAQYVREHLEAQRENE